MYDAWVDDILDEVRNKVVGPYWHPYFDTPFYKKVLKHLIQHSKFDNDSPVMGDRYDLYFKYNNYYRLENNSETHDYLHNYLAVEDKDINNILTLYKIIIKHIVKTQGYEDNMLSESNDKQKQYLDKVVESLLKESQYRFWENRNKSLEKKELHLIRVEIIFALINTRTGEPIEHFGMDTVKNSLLRRRRRKKEYIEDYEEEHLTNIYGLNSEEHEEVIFNYYNKLYNNIYNSYLEMDEDDKVPTSKPEKWMRGDEVFEIGGSLNESLSSRVNKDVDDLFSTNKKLSNEKKIKSIFMDKYGMNKQDADQAMVIYLSKKPSLNESDRQGGFLDKIIEQLVKETILYPSEGMISLPSYPDEKWNARRMFDRKDYFYNRLLTHTVNHCRGVYGLTNEEINYVWNKYFDQIHTNYYYLKKLNKKLNETTEKPKGFNLKYLFKVADSIIKEIELDDYDIPGTKMRGYGPWNDNSTGHYGFWTGLEKHAKNTYGLTQAETEMVSGIVWDSLNSKNMYLSDYIHSDEKTRKHFGSLREQIPNDWGDYNKIKFRDNGITVLSTDTKVPFFKRIDSKEMRYLKKVLDRMDKETKIESVGDSSDGDYLLITPFGKFEFFSFMKEYRQHRFEKYVDDIYGVGGKQIIFPVGNDISQTRLSDFLWGMYKEKLKIKQLRTIYPDLDIPDNAIITENDLTGDEHKSLLQSFEVMDTPEEIATEELGDMIKWVKTLPEELFLYRVLYLDDVNDINYDELGSHYSQDRTDLINNHHNRGSIYGHGQGEYAYLITVKVPKSEVDVMETLNNNILYPHEKEITLKDKGRGATYLDIEKI